MESFLGHIVASIDAKSLPKLKDHCYVLPTRRAGLYFKKLLMEKFPHQTFWSPYIFSIDDFIISTSGQVVTNDITLLFELYQVYAQTYLPNPTEDEKEDIPTFDHFYAWGQVLLKDFDEVDKYLVDPDLLYRNLGQLADIESAFGENEEMLEALQHFNQVMGQEEPTKLLLHFSNQWNRVCKTYHAFRKHLDQGKMAYAGMLYRNLVEGLEEGTVTLPYKKIVFAGFNALSTSEERLFDLLLGQGLAEIYWDADKLYFENEQQQAGRFLRIYHKKWRQPQVHWIVSDWQQANKKLRVIGTAKSMAQAKVTGDLIQKQLQQSPSLEKTAVVLADEKLLFPVLYALPKEVKELNVTMGYPLRNTSLFTLSEAWIKLQTNGRGKATQFYVKGDDLYHFLSHPLVHGLAPSQCQQVKKQLKKNKKPWVAFSFLQERITHAALITSLQGCENTDQLLERLGVFLVKLHQASDPSGLMEQEFSYHYIKHLSQFREQLREHHLNVEGATLLRLLRDTFTAAKVAFSGEPLTGLQVMGFLETRSLDFEHLYILSVNEKKLPAGKTSTSYIPFALRKVFKLPTFEEQDAIYAYHFHRVVQRASSVTLLYDTEVAVDGSGEKSRFIRQLEQYAHEEQTAMAGYSWNEFIYHLPLDEREHSVKLSIRKTPVVLQAMEKFLNLPDQEVKGLAPTNLTTYIECSLRFYFHYVAQLPERRGYSHDMDPRDFGNLTHQALQLIYTPYLGQKIDAKMIRALMNPEYVNTKVKDAFQSHYQWENPPVLEGRNLLYERIIQRLVLKVLESDFTRVPFVIEGLEKELHHFLSVDGRTVALRGSLDRIQRTVKEDRETVQIIDYKTGQVDLVSESKSKNLNIHDYLQEYFSDSKYKSGFQSYFYAYLWHRNHESDPIMAGIFGLKKSSGGVEWLQQSREISSSLLIQFEALLKDLLREIFDPDIPFRQTDDLKKCTYCPYKEICQR